MIDRDSAGRVDIRLQAHGEGFFHVGFGNAGLPSVASIRASMRGAASLILGTIAKIDRCRSAVGAFKISWEKIRFP